MPDLVLIPACNIPGILEALRELISLWSKGSGLFSSFTPGQTEAKRWVSVILNKLETRLTTVASEISHFRVPPFMQTMLCCGSEMSFFTDYIYESIHNIGMCDQNRKTEFSVWVSQFITSDRHLVRTLTNGPTENTNSQCDPTADDYASGRAYAPSGSSNNDSELRELRNRISQLEQQNSDLQCSNRDLSDTAKYLDKECQDLVDVNDKLYDERDLLKTENERLKTENERLKTENERLKTENRASGSRPAGSRPAGSRPAGSRPAGSRPAGSRPGNSFVLGEDVPVAASAHQHYLNIKLWTTHAKPVIEAYRNRTPNLSKNISHIKGIIQDKTKAPVNRRYLLNLLRFVHPDKTIWRETFSPDVQDFVEKLGSLITGLLSGDLAAEFPILDKKLTITL